MRNLKILNRLRLGRTIFTKNSNLHTKMRNFCNYTIIFLFYSNNLPTIQELITLDVVAIFLLQLRKKSKSETNEREKDTRYVQLPGRRFLDGENESARPGIYTWKVRINAFFFGCLEASLVPLSRRSHVPSHADSLPRNELRRCHYSPRVFFRVQPVSIILRFVLPVCSVENESTSRAFKCNQREKKEKSEEGRKVPREKVW